jgi:hypothetical protein
VAYDPSEWHDFYVMAGGAAAALAGLLFVAMSLHADAVMRTLFYRNRAVGMLMSLTTQLLLSAAVLVPGQPLVFIGVEVEIAALFWAGIAIRAFTSWEPTTVPVPVSRLRSIAEMAAGITWNLLFLAAGLSLLIRFGGGFYLLALVMVFAFAWNIYVAWVLITEVSEAG